MKTKEEKFNFWFSAFLLTGMVLIAVYSFIYEAGKPEARVLMQAIAGGAAVMGVTNTVLSAIDERMGISEDMAGEVRP